MPNDTSRITIQDIELFRQFKKLNKECRHCVALFIHYIYEHQNVNLKPSQARRRQKAALLNLNE